MYRKRENEMSLTDIQRRFEHVVNENEIYYEKWEKLKILLFSSDKENVVQGMSLIEQLEEEVYYDGICTFLKDDGRGNWILKEGLKCKNECKSQWISFTDGG